MTDVELVLGYHQRTKHHTYRYAAGPGYLDWASQPDPFRTFAEAPRVELRLVADSIGTPYDRLYRPGAVPPRPLTLEAVSALFELALGLSAWKEYQGQRWALRCDPSSGNLHPTEGYLVSGELSGMAAGVHHYVSRDHALERRCELEGSDAGKLAALLEGAVLVGVSSIHWRESWKYGERALRYCQHDAGHVLATVRYAAAVLGWSALLLDGLGDARLSSLLGLDRAADYSEVDEVERERGDMAILICPDGRPAAFPAERVTQVLGELTALVAQKGRWAGKANVLSRGHVDWDIIERSAKAAERPAGLFEPLGSPAPLPELSVGSLVAAAVLIRQRRSAVSLDGVTSIPARTFFSMLDRLLPRAGVPPWDVVPWTPHVHCGIFVHRVDGLAPGLYALERDAAVHDRLRAACASKLAWESVPEAPPHLRLFRLADANARDTARAVSCGQEIAGDGAFSLGMIADFGDTIRARGGWWWRRLFWEAGVLGQVLYLEAEAAGVRGTGIGCYFDDAFHEVLGLEGDRFQSLYHFTVGGAVEDPRLRTLSPYEHLKGRSSC